MPVIRAKDGFTSDGERTAAKKSSLGYIIAARIDRSFMASTSTMTTTTATNTTSGLSARGKVTGKTAGGLIKFIPAGTTYELHLAAPNYEGPLNTLVDGVVRVKARKAYTVPSGGNFITPLYGTPRIIQGRVRAVEGNTIVIQAGTPVRAELPAESSAVELGNGAIAVGSLVNVVALPGAAFEHVQS
jgi:hypothetical protein